MSRRKLQNRNIRKINQVGQSSLGITLPIEILRELKWRKSQKVVVKKSGSKIIISDWKK